LIIDYLLFEELKVAAYPIGWYFFCEVNYVDVDFLVVFMLSGLCNRDVDYQLDIPGQ